MADIISGKSRFSGDKRAPIKKIINFRNSFNKDKEPEFDENGEEIPKKSSLQMRINKHRIKIAIVIGVIVLVVAVIIALVMKYLDNYKYSTYEITDSVNRDDIESSKYCSYGKGYVRYSNDGISYYREDGKVMWNQTFSMQKPQFKQCEKCIVVGDIDGNTIYSFNESGLIGKVDTSMPILQVEVASNGMVVAILEDSYANYINMYDTSGEKVYSVKTTMSGDGFPLDISVSSDAKKLIASFIKISGDTIKTNVVFYNFSEVGQNETERVVGGFKFDDIIAGDVKFINDTTAIAALEDSVNIYSIKEYPNLEKTIKIDSEIDQIFYSKDYIGLLLDNSENGDAYKLAIYNTSGKELFSKTFNTNYESYQFDGKTVILNNSSKFVMYNMSGKQIADISFDMPISYVLAKGKRGSYTIINNRYIQTIKLK